MIIRFSVLNLYISGAVGGEEVTMHEEQDNEHYMNMGERMTSLYWCKHVVTPNINI